MRDVKVMKKYVIGATDVKIVSLGLTIYRDYLLELARRFLSGYNVDVKVKEAVHREVEALEKVLREINPETEFILRDPDEATKRLMLNACEIFDGVFQVAKKRVFQGIDIREIDYLEKRLRALKESPILLEV
ncbi:MAG: hypothetical protein QXW50_03945 [Nitrososphaerota archaeon]